jgi:DNA-binding LacI/PurR family transcriptional regulator
MPRVLTKIRSRRPANGTDVARLAGVSKSAVSRAYTGGLVSDDARVRIQDAARRLKYRPSLTARSLTTSRSQLIGVAITHLDNQFYPEVLEKLSNILSDAGFRVVLFVTRGEIDMEPVLDELLRYRLDGVVLASSSMASRVATECREAHVPVVMLNNVDPAGLVPGVCADNVGGAALVARYLMAADHRTFGMVTGLAETSTSNERARGFCNAIRKAGLPLPLIEPGEYSFAAAARATKALIAADKPPDAIFCVNDHMALAALQAARALGRVPGRDLSIVGFDNVGISAWPAFSLTTYAQPVDEMIEQVATQLLAAIAGQAIPATTTRLPGRLYVRGSARRAPGIQRLSDGTEFWDDPQGRRRKSGS